MYLYFIYSDEEGAVCVLVCVRECMYVRTYLKRSFSLDGDGGVTSIAQRKVILLLLPLLRKSYCCFK